MPELGCYFTARGRTFDAAAFLKRSPLKAALIFHRGQPLRLAKGKTHPTSGFSVTVNHTREFGDLHPQIPQALKFLRTHRRELLRLSRYPGVSELWLVFPCCRPADTYGVERFPAELLALAGAYGIGIELSFYPADDTINAD